VKDRSSVSGQMARRQNAFVPLDFPQDSRGS
jgi:hypothetical protein